MDSAGRKINMTIIKRKKKKTLSDTLIAYVATSPSGI